MFQKLAASWELVKASARVLWADKELLIFPILSSIALFFVSAVFIVPMAFGGLFDALFSQNMQIGGLIVGFLFYTVQYTVIFFANTALVGAAMIRLDGGDPTVADGVRVAAKNFVNILGYALIAATVGILMQRLNERSKGFGQMAVRMVGMAWNLATFLVVPVLAVEGVGPIEAVKRSVALLKKTWGEQIAGNLGLGAVTGLAFFLVMMGGIALLVVGGILGLPLWALIAGGVALVVVLMLLGLVSSTLSGIYTAAVYKYATKGEAGEWFDPEMIKHTFKAKLPAGM
ncbi:MAG: hypothetical protein EPO32_08955 [Anaerolineae bacterium]|nr:MAG: hypothetical protein EPO32_08955 [Anaerolineae bacterium]